MPETGPTSSLPFPPGQTNPVRTTLSFQRAPLDYIGSLFDDHGDVTTFRLLMNKIVVLRHPHHIRHILQVKPGNYDRSTVFHKMARNLFGRGLATIEGGPEWRNMRRLMQPSFHYQRVASMAEHMVSVINARLDLWAAKSGEVVDAGTEMRALTLRVVARALFALEEEPVIDRFHQAIETVDQELAAYTQFPLLPLSVPTAGHRRFWASYTIIEEIIDYVITQHLTDQVDRGDLLSMLIQSVDETTGARLTDEQLRDEVFVMLFAGHETGANVLTWVWYRLGLHPEVQLRVQQEVDNELDGRSPTLADCSKLPYTQSVIDETQRMYPQQWQGWRKALEEDEIGGFRIPAGTDIFYSPYHVHRHPEFWDEPEEFRPERFSSEEVAKQDRSAYLPLGSGPHKCIGSQFALTEMMLVIASTVQRFRIELESPEPIAAKPMVTLGPEKPVRVRLLPRARVSR
jgi:cytochrome P450